MPVTTKSPEEIRHSLAQCQGGDQYHATTFRRLAYTDGVQMMAELCEAYWLIDAVASYQCAILDQSAGAFQVWTLALTPEGGAVLECRADTDSPVLIQQAIEYTDFPLPEGIKLYVEGEGSNRVLLLPGEH